MKEEVMGSNPVESPEFFRFTRQLLKLSKSARIISSFDSKNIERLVDSGANRPGRIVFGASCPDTHQNPGDAPSKGMLWSRICMRQFSYQKIYCVCSGNHCISARYIVIIQILACAVVIIEFQLLLNKILL